MAVYNVHGGHNRICPGAGKYLDEVTEDRAVKDRVIALLRAAGHTVYDCTDEVGRTAGQNLANIVAKCNSHRVDLDISIHLNAGGGTGVEVWYYSGSTSGLSRATAMSAAGASALGLRNRGAKPSTGLYVLRNTVAPAVLAECCFVDSTIDQKAWQVEKMAKAIVESVTGAAAPNIPMSPSYSSGSTGTDSDDILVDGFWGWRTTRKAQAVFGTQIDGVVSNQPNAYRLDNPGIDSSFEWQIDPSGYSPLIKAIQIWAGMPESEQDGRIGPKTISAIQRKLGCAIVDGYFSAKSPAIMSFQTWLNNAA